MLELFQVIALLCQLGGGGSDVRNNTEWVDKCQLKCQKYYINCVYEEVSRLNADINGAKPGATHLRRCIQKRKIKY